MPVLRRFADVGVGVEAEDSVEVAEVEVANVAVADIDEPRDIGELQPLEEVVPRCRWG